MRLLKGFLLVLLACISAPAPSITLYPINPNMTEKAVFISGSGLTRLEYEGLVPTWHSLEGVQPFEPVVVGNLVVVGSPVGVFAVAADSGEVRWHMPSNHSLYTPTIVDGTGYVGGEDGSLRAVDLNNGHVRWQQNLSGWVFSPAVVGNHLVTGGGSGTLWGVSIKDGSTDWQRTTGAELIFRPVAAEAGPVYVSTIGGRVLAVAAEDGSLRWEAQMGSPTTTIVYGERLFLGELDGRVTAHNRYTGDMLWEYQLDGPTTVPLRVFNGKVLAISDDGNGVVLDPETGEVLDVIRHPDVETPTEPFADGPEILAARETVD